MSPDLSQRDITQLLEKAGLGDRRAASQLFPLVYEELRRLAFKYVNREWKRRTLQPTELVHEAYLRLVPDQNLQWKDRAHFFAIAARSMRQVLVERARARGALKRGGGEQPVTLADEVLGHLERSVDLLALDTALTKLAALDPKQAELVELRFFGGLTIEEAAMTMGTSPASAKRWWAFSKAWLRRELEA